MVCLWQVHIDHKYKCNKIKIERNSVSAENKRKKTKWSSLFMMLMVVRERQKTDAQCVNVMILMWYIKMFFSKTRMNKWTIAAQQKYKREKNWSKNRLSIGCGVIICYKQTHSNHHSIRCLTCIRPFIF